MEISRINTAAQFASSEARRSGEPAAQTTATRRPAATESLPLERLQASFASGSDVDLDRVAAIRQALADGSLSSDPAELAASMLAYHRGAAL